MKRGDDINKDYWFLRDNGVQGVTAIYIIGLAYKDDVIVTFSNRRKKKNEFRRSVR